jgi:amidase
VPGGSSAGSAAAVAGGLCDTALGTDTGGSVRVPASFCGLYGIRPTHGRIDIAGMMQQAPTSDTTGWFARDADTFARVSAVMLGETIPAELPRRLLIAVDAFAFAEPDTAAALQPMLERLTRLVGGGEEVVMAPPGLTTWYHAQRTLQPAEAWATFRDWVDKANPRFQFSVARNLVAGAATPPTEIALAEIVRQEARGQMRRLLAPGTILCLPTTPFPAPLKGLPSSVLAPMRERISCLTSHGGLTGVPQISIPGATVDGAPVGLSIIGGRDTDLDLVQVAVRLAG